MPIFAASQIKPGEVGAAVARAIDSAIAAVAPGWAVRRAAARSVLAAYEAAKPSRQRKPLRDRRSGNASLAAAGPWIWSAARELDENHDIVKGALDTLVDNIIGAAGIRVEPQPKDKKGRILDDLAAQLRDYHRDWRLSPEVTKQCDWPMAERLLCRSWLRDGEALAQHVLGTVPYLDHRSIVPYSLELLESDFLPLADNTAQNIYQGIQRNAWGQPTGYWVYKSHPGDNYQPLLAANAGGVGLAGTKFIPAERMLHIKTVDRIGQLRGVSRLASVITRLQDLKEYEEFERIAAKIAASLTVAITKGSPDLYVPPDQTSGARELALVPGLIIDDLAPGESIEMIDSKRPNTGLVDFRNGQLRAVAAGVGVSASSLMRLYDGSYSAQRQELVEQWMRYASLQAMYTAQVARPVYRQFVAMANAAGLLKLPKNLDLRTLDDASYRGPVMPWIDPNKEAEALIKRQRAGYLAGPDAVRMSGNDPAETMEAEANWRQRATERGLVLTTDPANDKTAGAAAP